MATRSTDPAVTAPPKRAYRYGMVLYVAVSVSILALAVPADAQAPVRRADPQRGIGRASRPFIATPVGRRPADARRAREALARFLREGQRQPYIAEQTTRLRDMAGESHLIVKRGGPGRERMEFLSPPQVKGEIILQAGGRIFNYKPAQNRIFEGVALVESMELRGKQFMEDLREGRLRVRVAGSQIVAGQNATIVEIIAGGGSKRFWIDDKTGVRLRSEELDAQGSVIQSSYFMKIDYAPSFAPDDFAPRSLPDAPREALFPNTPPLADVQTAQHQVAYPIREPVLPAGYRLTGVWVAATPGRVVTILRYTDGVTTFALFQQPAPPRAPRNGRINMINGAFHWISGDRQFTLLGNLSRAASRQVVNSLRNPVPVP